MGQKPFASNGTDYSSRLHSSMDRHLNFAKSHDVVIADLSTPSRTPASHLAREKRSPQRKFSTSMRSKSTRSRCVYRSQRSSGDTVREDMKDITLGLSSVATCVVWRLPKSKNPSSYRPSGCGV